MIYWIGPNSFNSTIFTPYFNKFWHPVELTNSKTAEVLNEFFSNIVKNLKIPEYENLNRNFQKVKDPVLKAILKYKNHPSIIAIKEK